MIDQPLRHALRRAVAMATVLSLAVVTGAPARAGDLLVFAAASLTEALDAVNAGYTGSKVTTSYAGSSTLARQIAAGAPADVFISANPGWVDSLERDGLLAEGSREDLLTNHLVVVGQDEAAPFKAFADIDAALGRDRLSLALTEAVPAGIYAKQALTNAGLWDKVSGRVAEADNVRAALLLVAWGQAPYGIVYSTDAVAEKKVHVVWQIADDLHDPILYPAAQVKGADAEAADYLAYLKSPKASAIFESYGFGVAK